jgi:23S rRNA (uracil1939-C5)-methyltransferase
MTIPDCPHRPPCPGCPRYGEAATSAPAALRGLADRSGATLEPVLVGAPLEFRYRARLAVRGRAGSPKVGIFQEGSHRIADIPRCAIHHPRINLVATVLREAMVRSGLEPYADRPHRGVVRYLQVVVERASAAVQVTVVLNADRASLAAMSERLNVFEETLTAGLDGCLHSLWWNLQPERTNTILGADWIARRGAAAVEERIGGARVFFPPGAFGQNNLDLFDRLVARVHEALAGFDAVLEFYAGCGAIGLGLAAAGHHVVMNEIGVHSLEGLAAGRDALGDEARARTSVLPGAADDAVVALAARGGPAATADAVLVDPPRRGLCPQVLAEFVARAPRRLVYVSCGLDSLVRDVGALVDSGVMRLVSLAPVALFPHTEHIETVAVLDRASP